MMKKRKIILGTMRFLDVERDTQEWCDYMSSVWDLGIDTLHSSSEYDSFPLLVKILKALAKHRPDIKFRHVVKLADPSFDDCILDSNRFYEKILFYSTALNTPTVHDIQWMWRRGLDDDAARISTALKFIPELQKLGQNLKKTGLIERLLCFPYSVEFARMIVEQDVLDGLIVYRNEYEYEYDDVLSEAGNMGKSSLIIRPFAAGECLNGNDSSPRDHLHYALDHDSVESAILSSNSLAHLKELV